MTVLRFPRTSQPQSAVGIDFSNPITRGLVLALSGDCTKDIATNKPIVASGDLGYQATKSGVGRNNNGSASSYLTSPNLTFGDKFSVVGLVVPTSVTGYQTICDADKPNFPPDRDFQFRLNATSIEFIRFDTTPSAYTASISSVASIGDPMFAAAVSDGASIFVSNGRLKGTATIAGTPSALTCQMEWLAQSLVHSAGSQGFNGTLLLGLAWNRALSDSEIRSLSSNPWQIFQPTARAIYVGDVAVEVVVETITRPTSDITTSGWTGTPDNVTLFTNIDESVASDADYITSPTITGGEFITFGISSLAAGTWDVRYRAQFVGSSAQVRITLMDASNVSQGVSTWQTVTDTFALYTASVTTTGAAVRVKVEVQ